MFCTRLHESIFCLFLALACTCTVPNDDPKGGWVGKQIMIKPGAVASHGMDKQGLPVGSGPVPKAFATVLKQRDDELWIRCQGWTGWVAKNDVILFENAPSYLTEFIRTNPKSSSAFVRRGWVWQGLGDLEKAIADFNEAIRLNPTDAQAYYGLGFAWDDKKEYDKAIASFNEAIRLNPRVSIFFVNRGYSWWNQKEYDKAIADYSEAIHVDSKNVEAFQFRGMAWRDKTDYDKAIADFDEAIRLDSKDASSIGNRAGALYKLRRFSEATRDFKEAIRLAPAMGWLYRDYALLLANCPDDRYRNGTDAVAFASKAIGLAGKDLDWRYHLALAAAYGESKKFDRAAAALSKALADKSLSGTDRGKIERLLELSKRLQLDQKRQ
jgi:Flp pilus assembly protein TadD